MLYEAYELESSWGRYITNGEIMGMTDQLMDTFIQYLTNKRCKALNIDLLFPDIGLKNPLSWFDSFSSFNEQKTNFFEGNVVNYTKGGLNFDF